MIGRREKLRSTVCTSTSLRSPPQNDEQAPQMRLELHTFGIDNFTLLNITSHRELLHKQRNGDIQFSSAQTLGSPPRSPPDPTKRKYRRCATRWVPKFVERTRPRRRYQRIGAPGPSTTTLQPGSESLLRLQSVGPYQHKNITERKRFHLGQAKWRRP